MKKRLKYTLAILIFWFCIHLIVIVVDGLNDEIDQADVAIIFGNKIESTGRPSERLRSRLNKGIDLYNNKFTQKIIVSGGIGKEGFDEALIMKDYLIANKVLDKNIFIDSGGNNTYLTAANTKEIMLDHHFDSAILITQYYHISRAKLAFKKFKINNIYSARANMLPEFRDFYSLPREFIAYYYYLFRKYP